MGKTAATLTALENLYLSGSETKPTLVLAPLQVAHNPLGWMKRLNGTICAISKCNPSLATPKQGWQHSKMPMPAYLRLTMTISSGWLTSLGTVGPFWHNYCR
ncbi:hypothetical protein ARAF_0444 [Arsenophonus endosymbiont of Aleurodicus floccissimus]|nr:hypothetical protein ARAF_0444 [Arsenophonus endosymbiont of Aleurodicus floccissimus]